MSGFAALAQLGVEGIRDDRERSNANQGFRRARKALRPFSDIGKTALQDLLAGLGNFNLEEDAGFQFARDQGLEATSRRFNSSGHGNSGNILAALNDRAVGESSRFANDAFNRHNNRLNHLASIAGMGLQASAGEAAAAQGNAGMLNSSARFGAEGVNNAIQGGIRNSMLEQFLNQNNTSTTARGNPSGNTHHF